MQTHAHTQVNWFVFLCCANLAFNIPHIQNIYSTLAELNKLKLFELLLNTYYTRSCVSKRRFDLVIRKISQTQASDDFETIQCFVCARVCACVRVYFMRSMNAFWIPILLVPMWKKSGFRLDLEVVNNLRSRLFWDISHNNQ